MNPTVVTAAAWVPSSFTVMVPWCLNCFKMERKVVRLHQLAQREREKIWWSPISFREWVKRPHAKHS